MHQFKRNLFGYRPEEVQHYLQSYERETQVLIKSKYAELDDLRENNQHSKAKIKATVKQIEALNQRKEAIFNTFVAQLTAIEDTIKVNQEEAKKIRFLALKILQQKIDELEDWSGLLRQCYIDLMAVQNKYQGLNLKN